MARKNSFIFEVAVAQPLDVAFTTSPTLIKTLDNCCYQINITTSDSTGTFSVQASLDFKVDEVTDLVVNPGNWITLTLAGGTPVATGANDNILIDLNQLPFAAIRLAYLPNTPGTGTCDVYIATRQLGG